MLYIYNTQNIFISSLFSAMIMARGVADNSWRAASYCAWTNTGRSASNSTGGETSWSAWEACAGTTMT